MPTPWRALLQDYPDVETKGEIVTVFEKAFLRRSSRALPQEAIQTWGGDQDTGELEIETVDGKTFSAKFQIIGTHDGKDFMWADANSSIVDKSAASKARHFFNEAFPVLGSEDRLNIGLRDLQALVLLTAEALGCANTFIAANRNSATAMFVKDLPLTFGDTKPSPERSFFDRISNNKEPQAVSGVGIFDHLRQILAEQLADVTLSPEALICFQSSFIDIHAAYDRGDYTKALEMIGAAKLALGIHFIDQEPAGWLIYCEGACLMALGQNLEAYNAFDLSLRAVDVRFPMHVRLGLARTCVSEDLSLSHLAAISIGDPFWLALNGDAAEVARVQALQELALKERAWVADSAEAVLRASLRDRYDQEKRASELSEAARQARSIQHQMGDADKRTSDIIDSEYRALVFKWFTPFRSPSMSSYSSEPTEDPENIKTLEVLEETEKSATIQVVFHDRFSSDNPYRYELLKAQPVNASKEVWLIHEVWSVWDHEDIQLH
jgi:hypothetical protein